MEIKLGRSLNVYKCLQLHEDKILDTKYLRFRALVLVNKPLMRMLRVVTPNNSSFMGLLKYERMPIFCFICGCIGHMYKNCNPQLGEEFTVNTMPYGS